MMAEETSRSRYGGFTLLELLVVIVIIAVLAGMLVPNLVGSGGREAGLAAERLVLLLNRARQEAVLSGRIWQVELDPEVPGYRFQQYTGGGFEPVATSPFGGQHRLKVELDDLEVNGQPAVAAAQLLLFPTGEQDGFSLSLRAGERERRVRMGPVGPAEVVMP